MTTAHLVSRSQLPRTPRLAQGRSVLWRSADCVQLGLGDDAMVLADLPPALAALVGAMDGTASSTRLVTDAVAAGAHPQEAISVVRQLQAAGLVSDDPEPPGGPDAAGTDSTAWSVHTRLPPGEILRQRRAATVRVPGSGRIAAALAAALTSAGVGRVPVGTGHRGREWPDVVVLTDTVIDDPQAGAELVARGIPHLVARAHEQVAMVGPLVLPGRTPCLRCVHARRGDADPAWPKLAAQLARTTPSADLGCAQVAAGVAAEQVLTLLAGPTGGVPRPPTWAATLEIDPMAGRLRRRVWSAHPDCGCGAAPGCAAELPRETMQA